MAVAPAAQAPQRLVLARYRPLRPLGNGSSGSVWLALDEASGREVALKIVDRDGRAASRAGREAAAAARLRHPHCLRAYDHAEDDRHVYIAYEYVPGRTVREAMRAGELTDADAVEAAAQVLEALAHAHERGIVHRDVKPANVLLAEGEHVSARLLDFGLARFADAETLTAAGDVPGTLAYISPERLKGASEGAPGDVFAVGVLLWEALAGQHPFWAGSLIETARKIEDGAPSLRSQRHDLPRGLTAAVDAALEAEPRRRPTAAQLSRALRENSPERGRRAAAVVPLPGLSGNGGRPAPQPAAREYGPLAAGALRARALPAALAALFAGWLATQLPFYPAGGAELLALTAAALTLASPRGGLAFALAVPILPLGNASLGLAALYGAFAAAWFLLFARGPRFALAFCVGPPLAAAGLLGALPLALLPVPGRVHRAALAAAGVAAAALASGITGRALPFTGEAPPTLDIGPGDDALAAASALVDVLTLAPVLVWEAAVLALAAAALPLVRRRGVLAVTLFCTALLGATLVPADQVGVFGLAVSAGLTLAVIVALERRPWSGWMGAR